jgi:hypothetical protein
MSTDAPMAGVSTPQVSMYYYGDDTFAIVEMGVSY